MKYLPEGFEDISQERIFRQMKCKEDASYGQAIKLNMTPMFFNSLKERIVNDKLNAVISIYGPTGSGKSMAGGYIQEFISKLTGVSITEKNIFFSATEAISDIEDAQAGSVFLSDEQPFQMGVGSRRESTELRNLEEIAIRKERINIVFCSPTLRDHSHHFILETWAKNRETFETFHILHDPHDIFLRPRGFVITGKPSEKWMEIYTKKAYANSQRVKERKGSNRKDYWDKLAEVLSMDADFIDCKNPSEKKVIAGEIVKEFVDLTTQEQKYIITKAMILIRRRKNALEQCEEED